MSTERQSYNCLSDDSTAWAVYVVTQSRDNTLGCFFSFFSLNYTPLGAY